VSNEVNTAFSALRAQMDALDLVANNLANVNTPGFKEELAYFTMVNQSGDASSNSSDLEAAINSPIIARGAINETAGSMTQTSRELDIAIEGNGFLTVQTPQGVRYTRNGNLKQNAQGLLSTGDGSPILNTKGQPIALGPGRISISEDGSVSSDNNPVDRMKVVAFNDLKNLVREGNSLYFAPQGKDQEKASDARIKSGYLEQSNVNSVSSMVRMVEIMRQFESNQKTINLVMNEMNTKVIEKLGR
jgi:flagellar basal-body rod protein FlgF